MPDDKFRLLPDTDEKLQEFLQKRETDLLKFEKDLEQEKTLLKIQKQQLATQHSDIKNQTSRLVETVNDQLTSLGLTRLNTSTSKQLEKAEFYGADFSPINQDPIIQESESNLVSIAEKDLENQIIPRKENNENIPAPPPPPKFKQQMNLNVKTVFPDFIKTEEGVYVFRIEQMKPILLSNDSDSEDDESSQSFDEEYSTESSEFERHKIGEFCIADCYIVLNTKKPNNDFVYSIWTWIGSEAEMDKRFCSAMYAVALKTWIGTDCRVERQAEGEESDEFQSLFDNFTLLDESFATESGLFMAQKKRYPLLLYRIFGKNSLKTCLVEPSADSLDSRSVYLLDAGLDIMQWNGSQSSLNHRSKCRILAEKIVQSERSGKAKFVEMDEKSEVPELWEWLGDPSQDEEPNIQEVSETLETLYRVSGELLDLREHEVGNGNHSFNTSLLQSNSCVLLDSETEIFLWIGQKSSSKTKQLATDLLTKIVPLKTRPAWLGLHKIFEKHEPEIFRLRFKGWPQIRNVQSKSEKPVKVDVRALYSKSNVQLVDKFVVDQTMAQTRESLHSISAFVFEKGQFISLPEKDWGHFYAEDAYIFLCVYRTSAAPKRKQSVIPSAVSSHSSRKSLLVTNGLSSTASIITTESENELQVECVAYFWSGTKTNKFAFSTFKFKTMQEMQDLIGEMYKTSVKFTEITSGRESAGLLSHLNNCIILHNGTRYNGPSKITQPWKPSGAWKKSICYQIWIDSNFLTVRAAQVLPNSCIFNSNESFLVIDVEKDESFYWIGSLFAVDLDLVNPAIDRILNYYNKTKSVVIKEETSVFKNLLIECSDTNKNHPTIAIKFLRCSCNEGYFAVREFSSYLQGDLVNDSCCIVDRGSPFKCFVWVGKDSSDVVKKMTRKSVEVYFNHLNDGRQLDISSSPFLFKSSFKSFDSDRPPQEEGDVTWVFQGSEPLEFKSLFKGWNDEQTAVIKDPRNVYLDELKTRSL